jgi:hypothetical protein
LISATAICIATVDLPDPPFSLPTTITRADRARVAFSTDMSALQNVVDLSDDGWFLWSRPLALILYFRASTKYPAPQFFSLEVPPELQR